MSEQKIRFCTSCGANVESISPNDIKNNRCPYCGHEIYDHSREIYGEKIEEVKGAKKKLLGIPGKVALVIIGTAVILFACIALYYVTGFNEVAEYKIMTGAGDSYTKKMEKCYKKKDWDKLYDIVILDCEHSINSPYYFTYRTAWFLSCFPDQFDAAYKDGDTERMKEIFDIMREDYDIRQHDYDRLYESVEEIEEALVVEYTREKEIMDEMR